MTSGCRRTKKGEADSEEPTPPRTGGRLISRRASKSHQRRPLPAIPLLGNPYIDNSSPDPGGGASWIERNREIVHCVLSNQRVVPIATIAIPKTLPILRCPKR